MNPTMTRLDNVEEIVEQKKHPKTQQRELHETNQMSVSLQASPVESSVTLLSVDGAGG